MFFSHSNVLYGIYENGSSTGDLIQKEIGQNG